MSDNWITDRPPTESDGDCDGDVFACRAPGIARGYYLHWSYLKENIPWRRTDYWKPPASAAELTLSDFKVGQTWRTRKGATCRIISIMLPSDNPYPIESDLYKSHFHYSNGRSCLGDDEDYEDDLISEAPEPAAEQPAQPAAEIPEPIRTGAAPFYALIASDDSGKGSGGNSIIWETQIPEGSSLQAVLQQQSHIGNRYGTTYVAECRIIPELTREVPTDAG